MRACSDAGQGETQTQAEFACANLIQIAVTGIRDDYNELSNARELSRAYLAFHDRRPFDLTIKLSVTAASLAPSQQLALIWLLCQIREISAGARPVM